MNKIKIIECLHGGAFGTLGDRTTITYFSLDLLEDAIANDDIEWENF